MSDQYEKLLDEQAKKKDNVPMVKVGKTWRINWEDKVVDWFKKLFQKEET